GRCGRSCCVAFGVRTYQLAQTVKRGRVGRKLVKQCANEIAHLLGDPAWSRSSASCPPTGETRSKQFCAPWCDESNEGNTWVGDAQFVASAPRGDGRFSPHSGDWPPVFGCESARCRVRREIIAIRQARSGLTPASMRSRANASRSTAPNRQRE